MVRIISFLLFFCASYKSSAQADDYKLEIKSHEEFANIAGKPLSNAFAGVTAVKIVFVIEDQTLYFVNSTKYPLHYNFCNHVLYNQELTEFNAFNYGNNSAREYFLATINFFRDANLFTLEFSPADNITSESVEMVYKQVREKFFDKNLFLQLSTPQLIGYTNWRIPVISIGDLFNGQKLQIIQKGNATGKLIMVDADSLHMVEDANDCIIILLGNSNDIPLCKGVITSSFHTPLSHISILSQNRKTPLIAFKDVAESESLKSFINQYINFSVLEDTFFIRKDSFTPTINRNLALVKLTLDTLKKLILPLKKVKVKETGTYGAKAVNLAQLQKVRYRGRNILTPEGAFAIPVFYYWQHIRKSGADTLINILLRTYKAISKKDLQTSLVQIQELIKKSKVDKEMICTIEDMVESAGVGGRFRFRSSSNAEDLDGFNGAGLYTSETGILGSNSKSIATAVKKVWASLWSERAFEERCQANIDQTTVGMAVLAHKSFPHEFANGVAITKNLYRDFDFGFVVNLQLGDNSLVKPEGTETCEQFISYFNTADPFFNEKDAIEYLSFSSLNNHIPILSREEVFDLTQQLDCIKRRFYRVTKAWKNTSYKNFAMDVEFKAEIIGNKKVFYFKQARPF